MWPIYLVIGLGIAGAFIALLWGTAEIRPIGPRVRVKGRIADDRIVTIRQTGCDVVPAVTNCGTRFEFGQVAAREIECAALGFVHVQRGDPGAALQQLACLQDIEQRAERYRLRIDRSLTSLASVLEALARQQVTPVGLSAQQATLDDVFLQLTGRALAISDGLEGSA